jgi:hypothetical protein
MIQPPIHESFYHFKFDPSLDPVNMFHSVIMCSLSHFAMSQIFLTIHMFMQPKPLKLLYGFVSHSIIRNQAHYVSTQACSLASISLFPIPLMLMSSPHLSKDYVVTPHAKKNTNHLH